MVVIACLIHTQNHYEGLGYINRYNDDYNDHFSIALL